LISLAVGGGMIGAFYALDSQAFSRSENIWEGTFALIACLIISFMGAALLRISKLQENWQVKIDSILEKQRAAKAHHLLGSRVKLWTEKYAMFLLPFITVVREGLEAVVFIGGVGLGLPATSFPLPVICGLASGAAVGFLMYKGGNRTSLQIFLIISTCFLYLVAAGLFSKAILKLEEDKWNRLTGRDADERGDGPGSYDIRKSVWHVNCCSPELNGGGGWGIFNALFGWTNSATYGSVISYNVYWIFVILGFLALRYRETRGKWPLLPRRGKKTSSNSSPRKSIEETVVSMPLDMEKAHIAESTIPRRSTNISG